MRISDKRFIINSLVISYDDDGDIEISPKKFRLGDSHSQSGKRLSGSCTVCVDEALEARIESLHREIDYVFLVRF